jgi:murein DD-endopeptidase MepM/ murein hydrolase activator NlpD
MKKKRLRLGIAGGLFLALVLVSVTFLFQKRAPQPIISQVSVSPPPAEPPPLKVSREIIKRGQTLSDILSKHDFTRADIHRLTEDIQPVLSMKKIIAGHELRLYSDLTGKVQSIEYNMDESRYVVITPQRDHFQASIKEFSFETKISWIGATIEDNPIHAVQQRNEQVQLALSMAEVFAWDIDFYTELRKGDSFRMAFEKKFLDGKFSGYGEILALEFICQGKTFQAFRFVYPDTNKADYFDAGGKSLRKEFMKSPLPYARITSRFSYSRLHPIHKVYRAHYGVDYAAPVGYPVRATADGTVTFTGWNGASGRMVRIRHKNSYETMYLHLQRILVKVGDRVSGGQDIGTVGSSGESTGPHLDYRIKQGGSYINPLSQRFSPVEPLRVEFKDAFDREVKKDLVLLDAPLLFYSILCRR